MKYFVSTTATQGQRDNDFCFVPEGEIVMPHFICDTDQNDPDGGCGCGRSLGGILSMKATTTFRVVESDMTRDALIDEFVESMARGGWAKAYSVKQLIELCGSWADEVIAAAAEMPVGAVVEVRLGVYSVREVNNDARL